MDKNINAVIGKPTNRIDGPLKVTGAAKYSSDYQFPDMLYAVPVCATIASGTVKKVDAAKARSMPGVIEIFSKENLPKIFRIAQVKDVYCDEKRPAFADDVIRYFGQFVAIAVAKTYEQAVAAADSVTVEYEAKTPNVDSKLLADGVSSSKYERGNTEAALKNSAHIVDATYSTPAEFHSAIELHASVATYDGTNFTLYETTQAVVNFRNVLAQFLGVENENVRVITKFLGSGFGGKLWPWSQSALAATLARHLRRPIKLVMSRKMVFQSAGHRPAIEQRIKVGADKEGKLVALSHESSNHRSVLDEISETCGEVTKYFYSCPNLKVDEYESVRNVGAPTSMRGPGAVPGLFATESALDELAVKLNIDPLKLRYLNEPTQDEGLKIPFASRHLIECYKIGAEKFGWDQRNPKVGSMQKNGMTIGWGVAGAGWIAERMDTEAVIELKDNGSVRVLSGTQDIGTGTYTVLAQIVAEELDLPLAKIDVVIGDSALPPGPMSGGSWVTGSMIPALIEAAKKLRESIFAAAKEGFNSPFAGIEAKDLVFAKGRIRKQNQTDSEGMPFEQFLKLCDFNTISAKGTAEGTFGRKADVSKHSYGAQFVEVTWQKEIARLRVSRVVSVIDGGTIINPKAGRNQIEGAIVMGVGMALFEGGHYEPSKGAILNSSFADYILPVHADTPEIDVHFLEKPNQDLNAYGARGIGEIGLAGIAPAIANAVYHATGKRVRSLPITIEDLV